MTVARQVPSRNTIAKEHTWNAESVFESQAAWQAEYESVLQKLPELNAFTGRLGESATILADWFEVLSAFQRRVSTLSFYAGMSGAVDSDDESAKAMVGQAQGLFGQMRGTIAFAEPEILAIGESTLREWLQSESRLSAYEHYLDNLLRSQLHLRSAEVEEILGRISLPFSAVQQTASMLTNADLTFPDAIHTDGESVSVTQSNISTLLDNPDREVRRTAWENYADSYLAFKNTLASNYLASVKQNVFLAQVRNYDSALEAALDPYNIPLEVFHNLIDTYKKNIPTWHRYWEIKRKALGVDQIHPYDIWAPLTENEPVVSYEESVDMISAGMQPLGSEYVSVLRRGCLEERWVDIYPNQGKRQGAFSYGSYDTHPFIMMSFDDSLGGMSTLAHELGHSMHSYLTRKHQPPVNSSYSMFVAEVASNFNQALVRAHLFEIHDDKDFQIALIGEAMSNLHRYFFIMPTLARFEFEVHSRIEKGEPVTPDSLNTLMSELFAEGYGETMTDDPNRTGITWAQFGHLYVPFYTFQYATGISAAHALADDILAGDATAVENYLAFLRAGNSVYPIDALQMAGVDMSKPDAVEKTFGVLAQLVDRLETLTG